MANDLMTNDPKAGLLSYFTDIKNQIIDAATQKGLSASGKTLASLEVVPTDNGYELQADSSIYFMEHGRGPTSTNAVAGNPNLVQIIQEWLEDKGLDINPYAVAKTIHKNGTKLFRAVGNSGVLSVPLNLDALDQVFDGISDQYLQNATNQLFNAMDD
ncbi:hypothetical protein [uncultured Mucilaginibacter sp.]|uniref:hypothetical protein n=1 Tax=uncultured Mucilaginibacter sp. TaxID=797541 RepID=UPI0025D97E3B|nr:hypothetical protein [uncultured Mucilaginibacter sp.]